MNTNNTLTELDAAIIAEEQGWDYLPACDETELLLAEAEQIKVAATTQPKINRNALRRDAIRWAMPLVKNEEDWQQIQWELANHDLFRLLSNGMAVDQASDYYMGIIRFCEHACGHSRW